MSAPSCSSGCVKAMVDNIKNPVSSYYQSCDYGNLYLDMAAITDCNRDNDDELACETAVWKQTGRGPPLNCQAPTTENYSSCGCKNDKNKWWVNLIAVLLLLFVLYLLMRGVCSAGGRSGKRGRRGGKKSRRSSRARQ